MCQTICVQNTSVCQSTGGGIKSHSVTVLVYSYDVPGAKLAPPWGRTLEHRDRKGKLQNSSSLKLEGIEL